MTRSGEPVYKPDHLVFKKPRFPQPQPTLTASVLSELARSFWAKSSKRDPSDWLSVPQHLMDAADVVGQLFDHYLSDHHRRLMASVWDGDLTKARRSLIFLAGIHDVGKVSLHFCCQSSSLANFVRELGLDVPEKRLVPQRAELPHGFASQFAFEDAVAAGGGDRSRAQQWSGIVGVHHGRYPDAGVLQVARKAYRAGPGSVYDDPRWHEARQEIIRWMARRSGFPIENAAGTGLPELPIAVAAAYASTVVMADWLASNEDYFPLQPQADRDNPLMSDEQQTRAHTGWERANISEAMDLSRPPDLAGADFYRHRFGWDASMQPMTAQVRALEMALSMSPDLMIVEAPPGSGKTELGFSVVEVLLRSRGLQGVMIALPTQATTDAMFLRSKAWIESVLRDNPQRVAVNLAHGKSDLNEEFLKLFEKDAQPLQIYDDEDQEGDDKVQGDSGLHASRWMTLRWRPTLPPVVIGTIDQVLLAALKSRHVLMRHLGLMGKAVLIDEVHAADTYMQTYLEAALTWLGMYRVPVVLLSATLPSERRRGLVKAYRQGRTGHEVVDDPALEGDIGYPVITTVSDEGETVRSEVVPGGGAHVQKRIVPLEINGNQALGDLMEAKLSQGGCAVVIRNTVKDAQDTYDALVERFGSDETSLLHSRFLAVDRVERDKRMLRLFGKDRTHRPRRHIVVATQVIEQSLDVDFDLMVTDPAPMDLVLQRIGRLHRHVGYARPSGLEEALCHVLVEDCAAAPWAYGSGNGVVYGDHRVLRFLGILAGQPDGILVESPSDYAALTQRAYSTEPVGAVTWQEAMNAAAEKYRRDQGRAVHKAKAYCLNHRRMPRWKGDALVDKFQGNAATGEAQAKERVRAQAAVRDTEDQIPLLIVPIDPGMGNVPIVPPWLQDDDGLPAVLDVGTFPSAELVRAVRSWSVSLPPWQFRKASVSLDDTIDEIVSEVWEHELTQGWKWFEHPLLKGELILPMRRVADHTDRLEIELCGRLVVYTAKKGLEVQDL